MGVSEDARTLTRYIVLWHTGGRDWSVVDDCDAASGEAAVKSHASGKDGGEGTYVAVPVRSWKPMRVEQVQTVQTVITAADEDNAATTEASKVVERGAEL